MTSSEQKNIGAGIALAILATLIWSGNFVVARAVNQSIPPVALSFFRWSTASLILLPFAFKAFKKDWPLIRRSWHYFFWISLAGISLFNTFVYVGAHYTSAINLALIGTTSSPILSVIFARIFLKEKIGLHKMLGLLLCVSGVLYLLCRGDWHQLLRLHFSEGDLWVLLAAFCFAVYNTMVKKKPNGMRPVSFLFACFTFGTLLLLPAFLVEAAEYPPIEWNGNLLLAVLYLGLGASVICFLIWNIAIRQLGAGRTAIFGNLIPVFSSLEAVIFLHEDFSPYHIIGMVLVCIGIIIANFKS